MAFIIRGIPPNVAILSSELVFKERATIWLVVVIYRSILS